ncbi:MAG: hypothetical protein ACJAZ4_001602 [Neptuniibacter pectenicola]|jgi:hypothetical protein
MFFCGLCAIYLTFCRAVATITLSKADRDMQEWLPSPNY